MTIEQTVEIPASRRVTFDLPFSFPVGTAKAALVIFPDAPQGAQQMPAPRETAETLCGVAKDSALTLEKFQKLQREDIDRELASDKRLWGKA
jgi:hypothetical protein